MSSRAGTRSGASSADAARRIGPVAARTWPEARLRDLEPLAGDASARRYLRLRLEGGGAPPTVVAMLLPNDQSANRSEELTTASGVPTELPFINLHHYLTSRRIAVPALLGVALDAGVLLLEDVGDRSLARAALELLDGTDRQEGAARPAAVERLFGAAVDTLADIAASIRHPDPSCQAFQQSYDRRLIGLELDVVSSHGLAASDQGPARDPASDPEIAAALARLGDAIAAQPRVLMHRDYHAWNLHIDPVGTVRVLDFQDALIGPALYDLASLATDRDSDRFVTPAIERRLVGRFGAALATCDGPRFTSTAELERCYFEAVAYRTLRVIGRFRFLAIEKGKAAYLRFLPRMARQTTRALEALAERELLALLAARSPLFAQ